jgi:diadenosine tetraphosphatase ApaH/serine/threonine PP2A family protein phosphatase
VLADLVLILGDRVSAPPGESCAALIAAGAATLRGNHDRWVAEQDPAAMSFSDCYAHAGTTAAQRQWLGALPPLLRPLPGVLACHGTPADDNACLLEQPVAGQLRPAPAATIAARLGDTAGLRLVLCAHSHQPGLVQLPDGGPAVVNPGSVGCPAYEVPEAASPHVSEAGSPQARYAVLELAPDGTPLAVQHVALAYGWAAVARRAEANGRPRWAHALRTGRMPPTG